MLEIAAEPLTEAAFLPYGTVYSLKEPSKALASETRIVRSRGDGWQDAFTRLPLIAANGSLGLTLCDGGDFETRRMERHLMTQEAIFCAADPIVLAVAPPTSHHSASAADIRAFIVEPGMVAVMREGTWHDACHGIDRPSWYYWMAKTGGGAVWIEVEDGPVRVLVRRPAHD